MVYTVYVLCNEEGKQKDLRRLKEILEKNP